MGSDSGARRRQAFRSLAGNRALLRVLAAYAAVRPHRVRGVDRHAGLRLRPRRRHHRRAGGGGAAGAGGGRGTAGGAAGRPAITGGPARRRLPGPGGGDGGRRPRRSSRARRWRLTRPRARRHRGDHDPPGAVRAHPVGGRYPRSADGGQRGRGLAGSRRGRGGRVAGRGADLAGRRGQRVRGVRRPRHGGRAAGRRAPGGGARAGRAGGIRRCWRTRRGPAAGGSPAAAAAHAGLADRGRGRGGCAGPAVRHPGHQRARPLRRRGPVTSTSLTARERCWPPP